MHDEARGLKVRPLSPFRAAALVQFMVRFVTLLELELVRALENCMDQFRGRADARDRLCACVGGAGPRFLRPAPRPRSGSRPRARPGPAPRGPRAFPTLLRSTSKRVFLKWS